MLRFFCENGTTFIFPKNAISGSRNKMINTIPDFPRDQNENIKQLPDTLEFIQYFQNSCGILEIITSMNINQAV